MRHHLHEAFPDHPTRKGRLLSTVALAVGRLAPSLCLDSAVSALQDVWPGVPGCTPVGAPPGSVASAPPQRWLRPPGTHVDLTKDDVDDAADDDQEVKHVPGVPKIALGEGV